MKSRALLRALVAALPLSVASSSSSTTVSLPSRAAVHVVEPTYASWNIDPSCNRGFHHTFFDNDNLIAAATALAPSVLRFGGSGADALVYGLTPGAPECAGVAPTDCGYTTPGCLNATHWQRLRTLASASNTSFLFGVSFDLPAACAAGAPYRWNSSAAAGLLQYLAASGEPRVWGFELGNEVNNNGGAPCNLTAASQAAALSEFAALLRTAAPGARLVGPDSGYRDAEAWLRALLPLLPAGTLHAVTHHVYPGASRSNFNTAAQLDSTLPEIAWYTALAAELAPGAQIWAGEDGPIGGGNDGTCGADSVCGTFASALWYADDMALRARHGFSHYQRQDLFGGAYGLTNSASGAMALQPQEPLALRPDFWLAWLFKRVAGTAVLAPASSSATVRAYAFAGAPPSPFGEAAACSSLTLVLLNLDAAAPADVALPPPAAGESGELAAWTLAAGGGGPFAAAATLNGAELPAVVDASKVDPRTFLQRIVQPPRRAPVADGVTLPPLSVTFVCYE